MYSDVPCIFNILIISTVKSLSEYNGGQNTGLVNGSTFCLARPFYVKEKPIYVYKTAICT